MDPHNGSNEMKKKAINQLALLAVPRQCIRYAQHFKEHRFKSQTHFENKMPGQRLE